MPVPAGYREEILTPKTSRSVEAVWTFVAETEGRSLVLPDGRCDVILQDSLVAKSAAQLIVTGPATRAYWVDMRPGDRWMGVRLRPENGRGLWRDALRGAINEVARGPTAHAMVPVDTRDIADADDLIRVLPAEPRHDTRIGQAIDMIHTAGGRLRVRDIAQILSWSPRHLHRVFSSHVGLAFKTYAQLVQFHRALRLLQHNGLSIADAVFEAGYADHAHLTRSFRQFGGFTPSQIPKDLIVPTLFAP